jgi:hypothetical protein
MAINKSASKIGTLRFNNGNETALYIGANSNTGATIVWQVLNGGKSTRLTGKHIAALAKELAAVFTKKEAAWIDEVNFAALDCLTRLA